CCRDGKPVRHLMPGAWVVSQVALGGADRTQPADLESAGQPRASMGACRSRNDGCASSRHMRRYREPFPVLLRPAIGVAPVRLLSVRRGVTGRREVAHDADLYSCTCRFLIATGFAVCSRKAARSTSDLSGFEQ